MRWRLRRRRWGAMGIGCGLASWVTLGVAVWYATHMIAPPGMLLVGVLAGVAGALAGAGALFGALGLARPPRAPGVVALGISGTTLALLACVVLGS